MTITVVTAPTQPAITLRLVKQQASIDTDDDDELIYGTLMPAALAHTEAWLGKRLITQVVDISYDDFPSRCFRLPIGPVQSVDSITYTTASVPTVLATSEYEVKEDVIRELNGWPSVDDIFDAVVVRATVGYGAQANVPGNVRAALAILTGHLYDHRELVVEQALQEVPLSYSALLGPSQRHVFA